MGRLWARTVSFASVQVGDQLPTLVKWATGESIAGLTGTLSPEGQPPESPDGANAPEAGPDAAAPAGALAAYVTELLEKAFPVDAITAAGSRLRVERLDPLAAMDIISLSGRVVDKREEAGRRLVDCQVVVENNQGVIVARATATVAL